MRDLVSYLVVGIFLALFAGVTWLSRHPDSEILERAQEWPLVGRLAERFRGAYLAPEAASEGSLTDVEVLPELDTMAVRKLDEQPTGALPRIWVEPGTAIHERPAPDSRVLHTVDAYANMAMLTRRGDWYRVHRVRSDGRLEGWVYLEDYGTSQPLLGGTPDPVLALPASPPDPERLAEARKLLAGGGSQGRCGPYLLLTDVVDPALHSECQRLAAELEARYPERYGLRPVSEPAGAILLFRRPEDYLVFRSQEEGITGPTHGHASPSGGYVALYAEQRFLDEVQMTLIHELTHLMNRRALGPALPDWLDEGIADDLAESRIGPDGRLEPGTLGGERVVHDGLVMRRGGVAGAILLRRAYERREAPALERLLNLDRQEFQASGRRLHYCQSSAFVRYLLSGREPAMAEGFRSYLASIAAGGPATSDALLQHLGRGWPELEEGFGVWVRLQVLVGSGAVLGTLALDRVPA